MNIDTALTNQKTVSNVVTRGSSVPSVVDQLSNVRIPVNIRLIAQNNGYRYLSTASNGNLVDLYNKDDESLRQRWYVSGIGIGLAGGNSSYSNPYLYASNSFKPILGENSTGGLTTVGIIQDPNDLCYYNIYKTDMFLPNHRYLQPEGLNSSNLYFGEYGDKCLWEIMPIGNYEIINLEYKEVSDGFINLVPKYIVTKHFVNSDDKVTIKNTFKLTEKTIEKAMFSKTEGATFTNNVSMSMGFSLGTPSIVDGKFTNEVSSTNSWSFTEGKEQTSERTMEETIEVTIPPHSDFSLKFYMATYDVSMLYVLTLKDINTGKELKVSGRWRGISAYNYYYEGGPANMLNSGEQNIIVKGAKNMNEIK